MAEIKNIPISELYPHPDNPRKDVGDVSELADSIKAAGILQNLTVVPGHTLTDSEWKDISKQYQQHPAEELRTLINPRKSPEGYTVIIGHRRLAAAKLAGLMELPCVVVEMTPQEQVGTMLLENMQRSDLTVYEQAQGFQMMLDLGETVETVAQKTGFSQSTVRRWVKLLDLDQEEFRKSESRGATLQDYMALDSITDPALKNQVLQSIGTANFQQQLKAAKEKEKTRAYIDGVIVGLEAFAQRIDEVDRETMEYQGNYGWWSKKEVQRPEDADTAQYYFRVGKNCDQVDLYRKKATTPKEDHGEQERKRRADSASIRLDELKALTEQAYQLRADFIESFTGAKKHAAEITAFAGRALIQTCENYWSDMDYDILCGLLNLDCDTENEEFDMDAYRQIMREKPEYGLLCTAYAIIDNNGNGYYNRGWNTEIHASVSSHRHNEDLDTLYDFLISIGYEMSDMEKDLQNGSHALFKEAEDD